jgi:isopropylmalate/homocitrate/citramalate synthase
MSDRIAIYRTTLRDGCQSAGSSPSLRGKPVIA